MPYGTELTDINKMKASWKTDSKNSVHVGAAATADEAKSGEKTLTLEANSGASDDTYSAFKLADSSKVFVKTNANKTGTAITIAVKVPKANPEAKLTAIQVGAKAQLVEIPEDIVPLANVPKTGDISSLWYVMGLLAACGLAILRVFKGKEEDTAE